MTNIKVKYPAAYGKALDIVMHEHHLEMPFEDAKHWAESNSEIADEVNKKYLDLLDDPDFRSWLGRVGLWAAQTKGTPCSQFA